MKAGLAAAGQRAYLRSIAVAVAVLALAMPAATAPAWAGAGRWTPAGGPPGGWINLLARAPGTPGTLYAGVFQAGVFKSTDDGATWTALRAGLPPAASPAILAVDSHHPLTVFAAYRQPAATPGSVAASRRGARST